MIIIIVIIIIILIRDLFYINYWQWLVIERTDKLRPIARCWLVGVWICDKALSQMTDIVYRLEFRKIFWNKSIICIDKNAENAMKC